MSTEIATIIPTEIISTVEKKPRAPRLPEKYGKFLQFAYYFMNKFNETADNKINETDFLSALKIAGSIDEQLLVVDNFFQNSKENKKNMNKFIKLQKNASTPKPDRKPRTKKIITDAAPADGEPPKRPRKKVTKAVNNTQDELINELVKRANSTEIVVEPLDNAVDADVPAASIAPAIEPPAGDAKPNAQKKPRVKKATDVVENITQTAPATDSTAIVESKPKPDKKPRAKKNDDKIEPVNNLNADTTDPAKKQRKPRAKKIDNPTTTTTPVVPLPELTSDENSDDTTDDTTDVSILEYHGKQFLIDDNNIVYDFATQDEIGKFDRSSNSLLLN